MRSKSIAHIVINGSFRFLSNLPIPKDPSALVDSYPFVFAKRLAAEKTTSRYFTNLKRIFIHLDGAKVKALLNFIAIINFFNSEKGKQAIGSLLSPLVTRIGIPPSIGHT